VTFPDDVLRRLQRAKTFVDALDIAREAAGSHDKLAALLGTSRQRIFAWEKGEFPGRAYREKLLHIGIPPRFFVTTDKTAVEKRLRRVEAEVASIRKALE
jgi:transcriptional regulator with XRE-family HTH domain